MLRLFVLGLRRSVLYLGLAICGTAAVAGEGPAPDPSEKVTPRRPVDDHQLRDWLVNMRRYHHYDRGEVAAATGLTAAEVDGALTRLGIDQLALDWPADRLLLLPYPGGRHPRRGFRDGAIDPQRETKFSLFLPWDHASYVVVDLPEAVWSNLGLTYLAHTHVPTIWSKQEKALDVLEWERGPQGSLRLERRLPNGIAFATQADAAADAVRMEMTFTNGTQATLSDLRVQMCVMLAHAAGFDEQTNENKIFRPPYAACRDGQGRRWIISAWEGCQRAWGNPPCPCLHSDPVFADCAPGESRTLRGWLSFYEGDSIDHELERIERTGWRD